MATQAHNFSAHARAALQAQGLTLEDLSGVFDERAALFLAGNKRFRHGFPGMVKPAKTSHSLIVV